MGVDIHVYVEIREFLGPNMGRWIWQPSLQPFNYRNYGMFGFLANVRNYSQVPAISSKRGVPDGFTVPQVEWEDYHSTTWVSLEELVKMDYNSAFEDRRAMVNGDGSTIVPEGQGRLVTLFDFLGDEFFQDLEMLKRISFASKLAPVRITMGFDG